MLQNKDIYQDEQIYSKHNDYNYACHFIVLFIFKQDSL